MHRTTKRFLMRVRSITLAASLGVLWAWPLAGYVSPWGNLSPKRPSGTSLEPEPSALVETPENETPRGESGGERGGRVRLTGVTSVWGQVCVMDRMVMSRRMYLT